MNRIHREWITSMNMHEQYINGKTLEQIGNTYGCTKNAVSQRFKRINICIRPQSVTNKLSMTPERRKKASERMIGNIPWNKGLTKRNSYSILKDSFKLLKPKEELMCPICGLTFYRNKHHFVKFCSKECAITNSKGKRNSPKTEFKKGQIPANYNGGKNQYGRDGLKTKQWREFIFDRDNYTCNICGQFGGQLEAHHIKPWAKFKEYRFDKNNGITLCKKCHKGIHKKVKK